MTVKELSNTHNWNILVKCPKCNSDTIIEGKKLKCSNPYCQSYLSGRISKWAKTLDIKELGEATIEDLIGVGVSSISSLYRDSFSKIKSLKSKEGYGDKSVNKIIDELNNHLEMNLVQFISGFNIDGISEKILEKSFESNNIKSVEDAFKCKSFVCDGVGEILSRKIVEGLKMLKEDIVEMQGYIKLKSMGVKNMSGSKLNGKSFCFTGEASLPRKELQRMVEENGGVNLSSVSKKLDYLVMIDPNSKSTKAQKARSLGINILSEDDFFKMVR